MRDRLLGLRFWVLVAWLGVHVSSACAAPRTVKSASFDWDDNVATMTTKMYLKKRGGGEVAMTTAEWAEKQAEVGKPGPYEDLYVQQAGADKTFRDMGDQPGTNPFLRELVKTVAGKNWQGPAWNDFVTQLGTRAGAKRASIITAREHSAESMYAGLKYLRQRGLIRYLPPKSQLFAVNRAGASVDGTLLVGRTPERKLSVQKALLDRVQADAQRGGKRRQEWHFSDDDWANYAATLDGLRPLVAQERWPNVDIVVHFTGQNHPGHPPEVVALSRPRI